MRRPANHHVRAASVVIAVGRRRRKGARLVAAVDRQLVTAGRNKGDDGSEEEKGAGC